MKQIIPYRQRDNDLFAEIQCECPSPDWKGTDIEHIMKKRILFSGYNDSYFWNEVNANPQSHKCECGRKYRYQWKLDGFHVEPLEVEDE